MNKMTPEGFFYLEGECKPSDRADLIHNREALSSALCQARQQQATHIVRFVCPDMCSSHLGEAKRVLVGPNNTFKTLADAEAAKLDVELASTIKWPQDYMEVPQDQEG